MSERKLVLVCGSRSWSDSGEIFGRLAKLPRGSEIIHGAARGADTLAAAAARSLGIPETPFPADWRGQGKRAGIIRNLAMLDWCPDLVSLPRACFSTFVPERRTI